MRAGGPARTGTLHAYSARAERLGETLFELPADATSTKAAFDLPLELRNQVTRVDISDETVCRRGEPARLARRNGIGLACSQAKPRTGAAAARHRSITSRTRSSPTPSLSNQRVPTSSPASTRFLNRTPAYWCWPTSERLRATPKTESPTGSKKAASSSASPVRASKRAATISCPCLCASAAAHSAARCRGRRRSRSRLRRHSLVRRTSSRARRDDQPAGARRSGPHGRPTSGLGASPGRHAAGHRRTRGEGQIVLFHVTANSDWSNLPMSGLFVDMLRRIASLGRLGGGRRRGKRCDVADGETLRRSGSHPATTADARRIRRPEIAAADAEAIPSANFDKAIAESRPIRPATTAQVAARVRSTPLRQGPNSIPCQPCQPALKCAAIRRDLDTAEALAADHRTRTHLCGRHRRAVAAIRRPHPPQQPGCRHSIGHCGDLRRSRSTGDNANQPRSCPTGEQSRSCRRCRPVATWRLRGRSPARRDDTTANRQWNLRADRLRRQKPAQATSKVTFGYVLTGNRETDETSRVGLAGLARVLAVAHRRRAGRADRRRHRHRRDRVLPGALLAGTCRPPSRCRSRRSPRSTPT